MPYPVTALSSLLLVPAGTKSRGGNELRKIERGSGRTIIVVAWRSVRMAKVN